MLRTPGSDNFRPETFETHLLPKCLITQNSFHWTEDPLRPDQPYIALWGKCFADGLAHKNICEIQLRYLQTAHLAMNFYILICFLLTIFAHRYFDQNALG